MASYIVLALCAFVAVRADLSEKTGSCSNVVLVSRSEWGARPYSCRTPMSTPVDYLFIHHTTGSQCYDQASCSAKVKSFQTYHMDTNGWCDIGYNFLVGGDGRIYEGRGWETTGAHTYGYNSKSVALSFIGDFHTGGSPTSAALQAAKDMMDCALKEGIVISNYGVYGHRDGGCTACPGDYLYNIILDWPEYGRQGTIDKICRAGNTMEEQA